MLTFIRYSNRKIAFQDSKKHVKSSYLLDLFLAGKEFKLFDAMTNEDLTEETVKKYLKDKKRMKLAEDDDLGPSHPLCESKLYDCQRCGKKTHNRFNCPDCWNAVGNYNTSDDYIHHIW